MEHKGAWVLQVLEESRKFTEEIILENMRLREELEAARRSPREAVPGGTSGEMEAVRRCMERVQEENRVFADKLVHVETHNTSLTSMYVASYRLHTTLDLDRVLEILKEIIINLVGSEEFAVYVLEEGARHLTLAAWEAAGRTFPDTVRLGDGIIGVSAVKRERLVASREVAVSSDGTFPIACIPLVFEDTLVGLIAIHRLLSQKEGFQSVDYDLFDLLASHAAAALISARLYGRSKRKLTTLQNVFEMLKAEEPCP